MQRAGELEKLAVLYGYQCRHQEEFAVRPRTLQFHNSLLQLITLQAFLICLSILHSWLCAGHMLHNVFDP